GVDRLVEGAQSRRNLAGRLVAELVAVAAAVELHGIEPLLLGLVGLRHAVTAEARARKQASVRDLQHRQPIDGGIVFRRFLRGRGGCPRAVYPLAPPALPPLP